MATPELPAEFLTLAEKYLAGELDAAEQARFERYLRETPGAADYCVTLGFTEALIPEAAERMAANPAPRARTLPFPAVRTWTAIAASVALGAGVAIAFKNRPASSGRVAGGVPARITQAMGVKWERGETGVGSRLASSEGAFESGLLELTLDSGVRLLIEGPAEYAVTGRNSLRLGRGKAVVDVPVPAQGFVMESAKERIVDHGTRFAVDMGADGRIGTLGVLSGIVDIENKSGALRLFTDYAVERREDDFDSVPFRKENFYREMPAREFAWSLPAGAEGERTLVFDVTALIHGPGDFRTALKWLSGNATLGISRIALKRDGETVQSKPLSGLVCADPVERDNFTLLNIPEALWNKRGKWTVEAVVDVPPGAPALSGVMHFAEGLSVAATARDFIGTWRYTHNGIDYRREIAADGTMKLISTSRHKKDNYMKDGAWEVKEGLLVIRFDPNIVEYHMLQEDGSLVFLNRNYRNAHKAASAAK